MDCKPSPEGPTFDLNAIFPERKKLLDRLKAAGGHCAVVNDEGYICTLPTGHDEDEHIAYGNAMLVCAHWPKESKL